MPWARLMRGSRSKLKTVAPLAARARTASSDCPTLKKLRTATPCGRVATSSALGAFTRTINPAPASVLAASGATVAPASAKAASLKAASWPAPDWMHTSQPAPTSFLTTSGTRATRRSPGRVSVGTANFTAALFSS